MTATTDSRGPEIKAYREKYWEECSDTEKIERLRDELWRFESAIMDMIGRVPQHEHINNDIFISQQNVFNLPTKYRASSIERGRK